MNNIVWKLDLSQQIVEPSQMEDFCGEQNFDQISECLPEGVYTTFRTYQRDYALRLEDHIQRLEHSAALMAYNINLPRESLRAVIRQIIGRFTQEGDLRLRLTVDLEKLPGLLYITAGALATPSPQAYQEGVKLVTWNLQRQMALAKRTHFIQQAQQVRAHLPKDVHEALMVSPDGFLLEGLTSNFFAVLQGGLYSAKEDILHGITRALVLRAAQRIELPVHLQALSQKVLLQIKEAFITSSSRAILPVKQIDDTQFLHTVPGEITLRLTAAFEEILQAELEPI